MPEAYPEDRYLPRKLPYAIHRHARLFGVARPRGYHNPFRRKFPDIFNRYCVIPENPHILAHLKKILNKVICEGIKIVYHQKHGISLTLPKTFRPESFWKRGNLYLKQVL